MVERMCHVCRTMRPKAELIRIVRSPEGVIMVDEGGKMPGRGCYVCRKEECIRRGVRTRFINRAFKCAAPEEVYQQVMDYVTRQ